jgi:hypothetical protein
MIIHRGSYTGTWADFLARVSAFQVSLVAFSETINQPAPLEDDVVMAAAKADALSRGEGWPEDAPPPRSDPTPEDIAALTRRAAIAAVQARLDGLAQAWGWDSIQTLMSADRSSVPRFRAEGIAGRALYDATWWAVDQNQNTVSSAEELFALLPPLPARPSLPLP